MEDNAKDRIRMAFTVDAKGKSKLDITVESNDGDVVRTGQLLADAIIAGEKALTEQGYQLVKDTILQK